MQTLKYAFVLILLFCHPALCCNYTPPNGFSKSESKDGKDLYINKSKSVVLALSCIQNISSAEAEKTLDFFPARVAVNYKISYQDLKSDQGVIARMYFKTGQQFTQVSVVGKYKNKKELAVLEAAVAASLEKVD
jgi:hypothetical protein